MNFSKYNTPRIFSGVTEDISLQHILLPQYTFYPPSTLVAALASSASKQQKEGKSCIEGAKYAAKKYLPPSSKMLGVTFHSISFDRVRNEDNFDCWSVFHGLRL